MTPNLNQSTNAGKAHARAVHWRALLPLLAYAAGWVVAYYATGVLGLALSPKIAVPSPLHIQDAVTVAALLLIPRRRWWPYLLLIGPLLLIGVWLLGQPLSAARVVVLLSAWVVVGGVSALATSLLRRFVVLPLRFADAWEVGRFMACAAVAAVVAAFTDATVRTFIFSWDFWVSWQVAFLGHALGIALFTPAIVLWLTDGPGGLGLASRWQRSELALLGLVTVALFLLVFATHLPDQVVAPAPVYMVVPALIWAAVRFGPQGLASSLALATTIAIIGAAFNRGPFVGSTPFSNEVALQLFLLFVGVPLFFLAACVQERKDAVAALQASEAHYRTAVRTLPKAAVLLFDGELRHSFADGPGLQMLGLTPEGVEGHTVWETFPADLAAALAPHYEAALAGRAVALDLAHAQRTWHAQAVPLPAAGPAAAHASGNPAAPARAGMVLLQDVTEQRLARDELERERTRATRFGALSREFRTLAEHSPDLIARLDPGGRLRYINQAGVDQLGQPAEQWIGRAFTDMGLPPDVCAPLAQALRDVVATRAPRTFALDIPSPPGPVDALHVRFVPELAGDGALQSVLAIATDVTALKHAEQALLAANAKLEAARQEEERRKRIAESLRGVLEVLNSQRASRDVLRYIVRQANDVLGSAAAAIYGPAHPTDSPSPETRAGAPATTPVGGLATSLRVQAAEGLRIGGRRARPHQRLPFADPAVERALSSARPVAVTGVDGRGSLAPEDPGVRESAATGGNATVGVGDAALVRLEGELPAPYRALLAVPIRVRDGRYGCLLLLYARPHAFGAEEVALAQAYADQVAQAITNARLQVHLEQAAAAAERNRLAQELHDTVKQDLYAAGLIAQSLPMVWQTHRTRAEAALQELQTMTQGAHAGLQALLLELRPAALEQLPLAEALRQLGAAMSTRAGVPVVVDLDGAAARPEPLLPAAVKVAGYRVAQEALMNAAKHARARAIRVRLRATATRGRRRLELEIADDGRGFDPRAIPAGHLGLAIMRERARSVGANVQVRSQPGRGTAVTITWCDGQKATAPDQPARAE